MDSANISSNTVNSLGSNSEQSSLSNNNQNNPKLELNQSVNETNGSVDESGRKFELIPRYASTRNEIEVLIVDLIKQFSNKQPPSQRLIGQSNLQPASSLGSSMENKNFLKLLQNACGFSEVRALTTSKLDGWLANPKVTIKTFFSCFFVSKID